ncbi:hypothetical protein [Secundilactobacillus folii]|uniref:Extracellular protein n=1 Tax=Secundilactobacillus folii TaxID=2678357 RepID=A0A7X3C2E5_9LACO|nr:hypothetical protein [Secundilactobacillus folii]MTV82770.1 hypothetical protein [Secundilactobacillus folii]
MRKTIAITGLWLALLGGTFVAPSSSSAKSLPRVSTSKLSYASSKLKVRVKAPKAATRIAVRYNRHTTYYKVKKSYAAVNYKFTGYKTFELYGTTAKHHRVTQVKKLSYNAYATPEIVNFGESRTSDAANITIHTLGTHQQVTVYNGNKSIKSGNTGKGKTVRFNLTLTQYRPKLTYRVKASDRKSSLAFSIPYLKTVGNLDAIN